MPYSNEVKIAAKEKLSARRMNAERIADEKRAQLYQASPRLKEIDDELSAIGAKTAIAVLSGRAGEELARLREQSLALQDESARILGSMGHAADYLEPSYYCTLCRDTGYVEENNRTVMCDCYKKLLSDTACEMLNQTSPLSLSSFEDFDLSYYSAEPDSTGHIPHRRMQRIYDYCVQYADTFSPTSKNLFMCGGTGLGKTHLSLAFANRVLNKGYSVVYASAPEILSKLEREHFAYQYQEESNTYNLLIDCDLLIMDDLGTEFQSNFTKTAIYNLFNTRIMRGKPSILTTNYQLSELQDMYSQRFVSRVVGSCDRLYFLGEDNRIKR